MGLHAERFTTRGARTLPAPAVPAITQPLYAAWYGMASMSTITTESTQ